MKEENNIIKGSIKIKPEEILLSDPSEVIERYNLLKLLKK